MKIGTRELTVKPLGAVQTLNLLLVGARQQYIEDAKIMGENLVGKEKAAFMAEMHRGLKNIGAEEAQAWSQTMDGVASMISKSTKIPTVEALSLLDEIDEVDLRALMNEIQPNEEEDERVKRFQHAVDAVLSARLDGNKELMAEVVEECVNALRSVSVIEDDEGKK
jgi:hypothetical protein